MSAEFYLEMIPKNLRFTKPSAKVSIYAFLLLPMTRRTTHSTLINSDVHRPSLHPRKCKVIRDLAAQLHFWPPKKTLGSWVYDEESKGCELRTWIASILQILTATRFAAGGHRFPLRQRTRMREGGSGPTCVTKVASALRR